MPRPTSFATAQDFRTWLERAHVTATELTIRIFKTTSGHGGITYAGALDEALCFGWIDGLRKNFDADSYTIRFSPRKPGSIWSLVNVRHVERLTSAGRMMPAGLAAYAARIAKKTGLYSFERTTPAELPADFARRFRANAAAWKFFTAQAPWYQRTAIHKVVSPKQPATRERWLARLIADSAAGRRLAVLTGSGTVKSAKP